MTRPPFSLSGGPHGPSRRWSFTSSSVVLGLSLCLRVWASLSLQLSGQNCQLSSAVPLTDCDGIAVRLCRWRSPNRRTWQVSPARVRLKLTSPGRQDQITHPSPPLASTLWGHRWGLRFLCFPQVALTLQGILLDHSVPAGPEAFPVRYMMNSAARPAKLRQGENRGKPSGQCHPCNK